MRPIRLRAWAALCSALTALGCGNGSTPVAPSSEARPEKVAPAPTTAKAEPPSDKAAEPWGTVRGQVTYGGAGPPPAKVLTVTTDVAHCLSKGPIPDETWVVNKDNKGVKDVIVWLIDASDPKEPKAPPVHPALKEIKDKEVVMDQPCCRFEPRVLALREGQTLVAKNSSPINHNFKYDGEKDGDNKLIPVGGKLEIKLQASARPVLVNCTIHGWMHGAIRVFDHPYFAVTDADGKFEIKSAPAGKYNLVMWHDGQGWVNGGKLGRPVEIKPGGVTEVSATAKPAE